MEARLGDDILAEETYRELGEQYQSLDDVLGRHGGQGIERSSHNKLWPAIQTVAGFIPAAVVFGITTVADTHIAPHLLSIDDYKDGPNINLPLVEQTVGENLLTTISFIIPLGIMLLVSLASMDSQMLVTGALGLVETAAFNQALTTCAKKMGGSLRPNFVAYCAWNGTACNVPEVTEHSARQSFPSGHASSSMSGMVYIALFLCMAWGPRVHGSLLRLCTFVPACSLAFWVSMTRVWDHFHRFEDIAAGMGLGASIAFAVFYCHFGKGVKYRRTSLTEMEKERLKTLRRHHNV